MLFYLLYIFILFLQDNIYIVVVYQLSYLYYVGRPKGTLSYKFPGNFTRDVNSVDRRGFVFGSSVHVDHPDPTRHPLYVKHATPIRVLLRPGDTL